MSLGSNVRPSIFGSFVVGSVVLFMVSFSSCEYSAGSGVKRVVCVLEGFNIRLFCCVQVYISWR